MKQLIYTLSFLMFIGTFTASAQGKNQNKAKQIETIKIAYLTRRLALTPEESQKFWPVYNQYQDELSSVNRQKKQSRTENADNPTQLVDEDLKFETRALELKKKYRQDFGKVLSAEKVKRLYMAERDFREELIKQLKNRRENN
ncbi:MAG: hypothetical protein ABIP95_15840 [Pelobium sp.]